MKNPVNYDQDWLRGEGVPAQTPEQAADTVAIEQILNHFCHRLVTQDSERLAELFTEDGEMTLDSDADAAAGTITGRKNIRQWHSRRLAQLREQGALYRYQVLVPVIQHNGQTGEYLAYLTSDGLDYGADRIKVQMGRLEAALEKTAAGWKIRGLRELLFFNYTANEHSFHENGKQAMKELGKEVD